MNCTRSRSIDYLKNVKFRRKSRLEDIPNEIFLDIFDYLKIDQCDQCFSQLNRRLNNLLFYRQNLLLIYDETICVTLIKSYRLNIKYLKIETSNECDLSLFPNLKYLIVSNRDTNHLKQIRSDILPNLVYLAFQLKFDFQLSNQLIQQIFTNQFQYLQSLSLRFVQRSLINLSTVNYTLQNLSLHSDQLIIIQDILKSFPNLKYFHLHLLYKSDLSMENFTVQSSKLRKFVLTSEGFDLTIEFLNMLYRLMPLIESFYFQCKCQISLIKLIQFIWNKFHSLKRFHCFIKEVLMKNERIDHLNDIYQLSPVFRSIQCVKENFNYRIFATD